MTIYGDIERFTDEHARLKSACKKAIELIDREDEPGRIPREERIELARHYLNQSLRYADGEPKNVIWTC